MPTEVIKSHTETTTRFELLSDGYIRISKRGYLYGTSGDVEYGPFQVMEEIHPARLYATTATQLRAIEWSRNG